MILLSRRHVQHGSCKCYWARLSYATAWGMSPGALWCHERLLEKQCWKSSNIWIPERTAWRLLHCHRGAVPATAIEELSKQNIKLTDSMFWTNQICGRQSSTWWPSNLYITIPCEEPTWIISRIPWHHFGEKQRRYPMSLASKSIHLVITKLFFHGHLLCTSSLL